MKFSVYDTGEIAMNYQEAMEYMEKVGTYGIVPGLDSIRAVSYTHLTLPTNREV